MAEPKPSDYATKRQYPNEIDAFASEGFLQFFFQDNTDGSFDVYILDERNHIEIYQGCEGEKEDKIREINRLYHSSDSQDNPYRIVQKDFNHPQFFQLFVAEQGVQIEPFRFRTSVE